MNIKVVLFDIDGTLVDSNFLHVEAWARTFADLHLAVPSWQIQRAIGADSAELLDRLIGSESDDMRERAQELHSTHYRDCMPRLQLLPGARELITALAGNGARIVLATSAPQEELDVLRKVLDIDEQTFAVTSAEDVEKAKPEPDIIAVALGKGDAAPEEAVMVGDSTWDMTAAATAGVRGIGVLSGGTGEDDLTRAGAIAVYNDADDLLAHLNDSPLAPFAG